MAADGLAVGFCFKTETSHPTRCSRDSPRPCGTGFLCTHAIGSRNACVFHPREAFALEPDQPGSVLNRDCACHAADVVCAAWKTVKGAIKLVHAGRGESHDLILIGVGHGGKRPRANNLKWMPCIGANGDVFGCATQFDGAACGVVDVARTNFNAAWAGVTARGRWRRRDWWCGGLASVQQKRHANHGKAANDQGSCVHGLPPSNSSCGKSHSRV